MTESEVAKVIKGMASKICEIDPILTTILKDILPSIIKPITNIINISMQFGVFAKTWKVAAIKPLLKKNRAGPDLTKLLPCQQPFISQ